MKIPFNKPVAVGAELANIADALARGHLSGNGFYTKRCHQWLEQRLGCARALLTHSGTGALDLAALLCDLAPGDEVIMPSYTFVATANAFALRGAVPVFVDVRADNINIDERLIGAAITPRTKAIAVVHYAGVACEMDAIMALARQHNLLVVEDAAQALLATYKGRNLGTIGHIGCISFHETKNLISGEGGALLINDARFIERAEIIREKGTDRSRFLRGEVDKYTWVEIGSSFLPSDIIAAFLWAQLEQSESIALRRSALWRRYHEAFADLEQAGLVRRPVVPREATPNSHCYFLLLPDAERRTRFMDALRHDGVNSVFHYVPLHSSPAGRKFGRFSGAMSVTDSVSDRLTRLPLWIGLEAHQDYVIERCRHALGR